MKLILQIRADCFEIFRLNPLNPFCYPILVLIHKGNCWVKYYFFFKIKADTKLINKATGNGSINVKATL